MGFWMCTHLGTVVGVGKSAHGLGTRGFDDTQQERSDRKLKAQTRPRESLGGGVVEARE